MPSMKLRLARHSLALAGLACLLAPAQALPVQSVSYASISGPLVNFESLPTPAPEGSLLNGLLTLGGVQFGEMFAGQLLSVTKAPRPKATAQDWFDDLSYGLPSSGLNLLAGADGQNLGVYDYEDADGKALVGIGPQHSDGSSPFGFGAISGRFATGQSALGFQVRDADGGQAFLRLYRLDGSLIDTLSLGPVYDGFYAYARSSGEADIAGFSLYHADSAYGLAIDNLVYGSITAVPEPGSALLFGAGLIGVAAWRGRRQPGKAALSSKHIQGD